MLAFLRSYCPYFDLTTAGFTEIEPGRRTGGLHSTMPRGLFARRTHSFLNVFRHRFHDDGHVDNTGIVIGPKSNVMIFG